MSLESASSEQEGRVDVDGTLDRYEAHQEFRSPIDGLKQRDNE